MVTAARTGALALLLVLAASCWQQHVANTAGVVLGEMATLQNRALQLFEAEGHEKEYHSESMELSEDEARWRVLKIRHAGEIRTMQATAALLSAAAHAASREDAALQTGHRRAWREHGSQLRGDLQVLLQQAGTAPCGGTDSSGRWLEAADCSVKKNVGSALGQLSGVEASSLGIAELSGAEKSTREDIAALRAEDAASQLRESHEKAKLRAHRVWRDAMRESSPAFGQLLASYSPRPSERQTVLADWAGGRRGAALERLERLAASRDPWGLQRLEAEATVPAKLR